MFLVNNEDQYIEEFASIVVNNEMTHELCNYIIDECKVPHVENLARTIRLLFLLDCHTFENLPHHLNDWDVEDSDEEDVPGYSLTYIFNETYFIKGITILVRARKSAYGITVLKNWPFQGVIYETNLSQKDSYLKYEIICDISCN